MKSSTLIRVVLALIVLGLVAIAIVAVPTWVVALTVGTGALTDAEWSNALTEERRTVLLFLGGLVAAGGLWYTRQRQELDRDANRTDRFSAAIDQIGDESAEVRLGGLYSLERISRDSVRDRPVVTEVISAYVRSRTRVRVPEIEPARGKDEFVPLKVDVLAALTILARQPRGGDYGKPDLTGAFLLQCEISKLDLRAWNIVDGKFEGSILSDLNFTDADLSYASFHQTSNWDLDFSGAKLQGAVFSNGSINGGTFDHADILGANMQNVSFTKEVTFRGADLRHTLLHGLRVETPLDLTTARVDGLVLFEEDVANVVLTPDQIAVVKVNANIKGAGK